MVVRYPVVETRVIYRNHTVGVNVRAVVIYHVPLHRVLGVHVPLVKGSTQVVRVVNWPHPSHVSGDVNVEVINTVGANPLHLVTAGNKRHTVEV